jgi:predicted RNase H-like nuclease (RuvC/YqgF family)
MLAHDREARLGRQFAELQSEARDLAADLCRVMADNERLRKELSYRVHTDEDIEVQNREIERLRMADCYAARQALKQKVCPDHPTGRVVDDEGKRICSTCGRASEQDAQEDRKNDAGPNDGPTTGQ